MDSNDPEIVKYEEIEKEPTSGDETSSTSSWEFANSSSCEDEASPTSSWEDVNSSSCEDEASPTSSWEDVNSSNSEDETSPTSSWEDVNSSSSENETSPTFSWEDVTRTTFSSDDEEIPSFNSEDLTSRRASPVSPEICPERTSKTISETKDIMLDNVLSPKQVLLDGKLSRGKALRTGIEELNEGFVKYLKEFELRIGKNWTIRREIHDLLFMFPTDEMVQQWTIYSPKREELLLRVRDEFRNAVSAYEKLCDNGVENGAGESLEAELEMQSLKIQSGDESSSTSSSEDETSPTSSWEDVTRFPSGNDEISSIFKSEGLTERPVSPGISPESAKCTESETIDLILDSILSPKQVVRDGKVYTLRLSRAETIRTEILELSKRFEQYLKEFQARMEEYCPVRRELYDLLFSELIRQSTIFCPERGGLLLRVRDEFKKTVSAYEKLFECGVQYGASKAQEAELEMQSIKIQHCHLQTDFDWAKKKVKKLQSEIEAEMTQSELRIKARKLLHEEKMTFLKLQNVQMQEQLSIVTD